MATMELRGGAAIEIPSAWDIEPDELEPQIVEAYAIRWGIEVPARTTAGDPCFVRYAPYSFDQDLFDNPDEPRQVDVLVGHGWPEPHETRAVRHPVGRLCYVRADDIGLRTWSIVDGTRDGVAALAAMEDGTYDAFSAHVEVLDSLIVDERDDGTLIYEVTAGRLVEIGPTSDPADPGAKILSVGNRDVDEVRAYADEMAEAEEREAFEAEERVEHANRVAREMRAAEEARLAEEQDFAERMAEQVAFVDALGRAIAESRSIATESYFEWTRHHRGADFTTALEADRDEREFLDELREACNYDRDLERRVLASAGAPAYRSPFRSVRTAIELGR
jgi:phage head maturation protease